MLDYLLATGNGYRIINGVDNLVNAVLDLRHDDDFKAYRLRGVRKPPLELFARFTNSGGKTFLWFEDRFGNMELD